MSPQQERNVEALVEAVDAAHREMSRIQREMLGAIAEVDRREIWRGSGARDMAHWLAMRQGISQWKARRWIAAGHALEHLTDLAVAFSTGELGIDKVVELARFASFETEAGLIRWATFVSCAAVRRRADLEVRRKIEDVREAERGRFLRWWHIDDGSRLGLEAELPAAQGAVVAGALQRVADTLPMMPGEEDPSSVDARRADALVAVCSSRLAEDADADRATVVVHARLGDLAATHGSAEIGDGGWIHPEIARRLLCDGRVQTVLEDEDGEPLRLGRLSREPSASMMRLLRPRRRMQVPRMRDPPLHAGAPHRLVGGRRSHRPRQPHPPVLLPPPVGARARMGGPPRRERERVVDRAGRQPVSARARTGDTGSEARIAHRSAVARSVISPRTSRS